MTQAISWQQLLSTPEAGKHIVQVYQDDAFLVKAVSHFIAQGLQGEETIIIFASRGHREAFISELNQQGYLIQSAKNQGYIKFFDAELMLATFMENDVLKWERFLYSIGRIIADAHSKSNKIRAYGEMVDILWRQGKRDAAIELEEFWNRLAKIHNFSLFCAYFMDNLHPENYDGSLARICKCHTHLIAIENQDEFEEAVPRATKDLLGDQLTNKICEMAQSEYFSTQMAKSQATLLFLGKRMPRSTRKILSKIQSTKNQTKHISN